MLVSSSDLCWFISSREPLLVQESKNRTRSSRVPTDVSSASSIKKETMLTQHFKNVVQTLLTSGFKHYHNSLHFPLGFSPLAFWVILPFIFTFPPVWGRAWLSSSVSRCSYRWWLNQVKCLNGQVGSAMLNMELKWKRWMNFFVWGWRSTNLRRVKYTITWKYNSKLTHIVNSITDSIYLVLSV